jgi:hypothetical protein
MALVSTDATAGAPVLAVADLLARLLGCGSSGSSETVELAE